MKEVNAPSCERENDLIAFLYGELNDVDAATFQRHARDCVSCKSEVAALQSVRRAVITWRDESVGAISRSFAETARAEIRGQAPSAFAAVREFFRLAPLWMKGAVAFASVMFCLFAGLAVARLADRRPVTMVAVPEKAFSTEEFNALVERRVEEELQKRKDSEQRSPSPVIVKNEANRIPGNRTHSRGELAFSPSQKARRPLSKTEREQLAADLRLIPGKGDTDFDLLDDRINQ